MAKQHDNTSLCYHVALPLFAKSDGSDSEFDARRFGGDDLLQNVYWNTELGVGCWGGGNPKTNGLGIKQPTVSPYAPVDMCCPFALWLSTLDLPYLLCSVGLLSLGIFVFSPYSPVDV